MFSSDDVGAVARQMTNAFVGTWTAEDMRDLVDRLGWEWAGESDGHVRVVTGLPGGDAVLVPVGARARAWAPLQDYLELVVPVSRPAPEPRLQAEEFGRIADAVRKVHGNATYVGAHGLSGPSGLRLDPTWGRPFLRRRRDRVTLELRAGAAGPELVLQAGQVWESWYARSGQGFVGTLEDSGRPLDHPRRENADSWDGLGSALGAFLRTLPAETLATGMTQNIPRYGRLAGGKGPLLFGIVCEGHLYVSYTEYLVGEAARGANARALGWTPVESLPPEHPQRRLFGDSPWVLDAGGPGEVKPTEIAALIVRTARAAGVESPGGLMIGGEARYRGPYRVRFPGLPMPEC
ncbi:hypothetical protein [Embleya sp. AB8]|uniref:hypothetical protein n=1 Tax=Embleya sp. AB8 TaxID=3156304 RepID=UPI003C708789